MSDYILSCCSTADLSKEHFEKRNIHYVCFHYYINDEEHRDDLYETSSPEEFFSEMAAAETSRTSQVNVEEFIEYFEQFLKDGKDILHVTLSTGLSGVYGSACTAANFLKETYPDREIKIVDSLGASSGYGLLMDKLADLRDEGFSLEQLGGWAEANKLRVNHWFFSTDLTYYIRGGRISKASGWFGTVLKICPLLDMDEDGHLVPRVKVRGKNNVIKAIVDKMEENADDGLKYADKCYISMSACPEDAEAVADLIESRFKNLKGKVEINNVGTTIGSHTGPGTVAVFFWGKKREETASTT